MAWVVAERMALITAYEDDLEPGIPAQQHDRKFASPHTGHDQVGEDEMNLPVVFIKYLNSLRAIGRGQDIVPVYEQGLFGNFSH